jgi:[ribosomal protein S5]-alanine N-acetyltransferase
VAARQSTRRIRLEPPTERHVGEFLDAVRRSRALHRGFVAPPATVEAYAEHIGRSSDGRSASFLVVDAADGGLAGVVNVSEIVRGSFQSAYLGYYAFVPKAGRGFMRAGLAGVISYAFNELKLHRLEANIQPRNAPSIALVRRLGFRLEGRSPRYLKIAGRWRDHERWAVLAEEWRRSRRASR